MATNDGYYWLFGFSVQNQKGRKNEDYFKLSRSYPICAVADGVTRDIEPGQIYPDPSGAALAAKEFCERVVESLEQIYSAEDAGFKESTVRWAAGIANAKIRELNKKWGIVEKLDYWVNDYFCTCGAVAALKEGILYYGYLGDCGLMVVDANGSVRFMSSNNVAPLEAERDSLPFKSEKERKVWWHQLRNTPTGYGVFTGEATVFIHFKIGRLGLNPGDRVFLFSDGIALFLSETEFINLFPSFFPKEQRVREEIEKKVMDFVGGRRVASKDDMTLIFVV